eukprot:SAG22_NODE_16683_length_320_cov_0.705882_1_plen_106_part_11
MCQLLLRFLGLHKPLSPPPPVPPEPGAEPSDLVLGLGLGLPPGLAGLALYLKVRETRAGSNTCPRPTVSRPFPPPPVGSLVLAVFFLSLLAMFGLCAHSQWTRAVA